MRKRRRAGTGCLPAAQPAGGGHTYRIQTASRQDGAANFRYCTFETTLQQFPSNGGRADRAAKGRQPCSVDIPPLLRSLFPWARHAQPPLERCSVARRQIPERRQNTNCSSGDLSVSLAEKRQRISRVVTQRTLVPQERPFCATKKRLKPAAEGALRSTRSKQAEQNLHDTPQRDDPD